jgi:hypothetical protein
MDGEGKKWKIRTAYMKNFKWESDNIRLYLNRSYGHGVASALEESQRR